MLEKKQVPYEFLARWRDGKLSGAHVGFTTQILEDGVVVSENVDDVMPVDVGQGIGFPLKDILEQLHVDAIAQMDAANAEMTVATTKLEAEKIKTQSLEQRVAELEKQNDSATLKAVE